LKAKSTNDLLCCTFVKILPGCLSSLDFPEFGSLLVDMAHLTASTVWFAGNRLVMELPDGRIIGCPAEQGFRGAKEQRETYHRHYRCAMKRT
jgi:hypothetical protein